MHNIININGIKRLPLNADQDAQKLQLDLRPLALAKLKTRIELAE